MPGTHHEMRLRAGQLQSRQCKISLETGPLAPAPKASNTLAASFIARLTARGDWKSTDSQLRHVSCPFRLFLPHRYMSPWAAASAPGCAFLSAWPGPPHWARCALALSRGNAYGQCAGTLVDGLAHRLDGPPRPPSEKAPGCSWRSASWAVSPLFPRSASTLSAGRARPGRAWRTFYTGLSVLTAIVGLVLGLSIMRHV